MIGYIILAIFGAIGLYYLFFGRKKTDPIKPKPEPVIGCIAQSILNDLRLTNMDLWKHEYVGTKLQIQSNEEYMGFNGDRKYILSYTKYFGPSGYKHSELQIIGVVNLKFNEFEKTEIFKSMEKILNSQREADDRKSRKETVKADKKVLNKLFPDCSTDFLDKKV